MIFQKKHFRFTKKFNEIENLSTNIKFILSLLIINKKIFDKILYKYNYFYKF